MVYSDLSTAVAMLRDALGGNISIDHRSEVAERWRLWCEEKASRQQDDRGQGVASAAIFDCLSRLIPDDAIITVNVGNVGCAESNYPFRRSGLPADVITLSRLARQHSAGAGASTTKQSGAAGSIIDWRRCPHRQAFRSGIGTSLPSIPLATRLIQSEQKRY
jgi:hypothetical protein